MLPRRPRTNEKADRSRRSLPTLEGLEGRRLLAVSFGAAVTLPAGDSPQGVVLADFNGDRKLDLAVAMTAGNRVGVRLGRGDGTFGLEGTVAAGAAPVDLAAADLNADGRIDLVVTNFNGNNVSVLLGNGDGTFRLQTRYDAGGGPRTVAVADLDGDGAPDLVVGNQGNDVSLYRGRGDGTFAPKTDLGLQDQANGVSVADMNGDGAPDILVAGYFRLYVFLNDGSGRFPVGTPFNSTGGGGFSVAAADVNGDGHLDVARSNSANDFVSVFLGDGRGGLDGPSVYTVGTDPAYVSAGEYPYDIRFADLDLDGRPDLVIASNRGVVVRPGAGDGRFPGRLDFARGNGATYLAIGDLNGDGKPDVVTANQPNDTLTVLLNTSNEPPAVTLAVDDARTTEGDTGTAPATITVRLSGPTTVPVTVNYATSGGTATPGRDYTPVGGVLTFPPGATSATVAVPVVGNLRVDGPRTVGLTLSAPTGPATVVDGAGTLTVLDDEVPSTFRFQQPRVVVDASAGLASVTVVRDDAKSDGVTVSYTTAGGTAVAGLDYTPTSGTLRFPAGVRALTFTVPLRDNPSAAGERTIGLVLSRPEGGTLGDPLVASIVARARVMTPPTPPPVVTVESVGVESRRGHIKAVTLRFSGPLDPRSAAATANYRLVWAGRDGRYGTRDDRSFAFRSASYDARTLTVRLTTRPGSCPASPRRLTVSASVTDARGYALDGDRNGLPGGDYQAVLRNGWYVAAASKTGPGRGRRAGPRQER